MRFSIIIPMHNAEKRCVKLLDSMSNQSFVDFEIIVVCDSCDDNTLQGVSFYFANEAFVPIDVTILKCNHRNAGMARNEGLEVAQGEYILFADDDDYILHPYVFEYIDRMLKAHDEPDVAHFGFIFGDNGYVYPTWNDGHLYGNVWSKAYKRTAIGDTKFPNVYPDDDLQFNKLLEQKDLRHVLCDAPIYYYNYMREGSISDIERKKKNGQTSN